MTGKDSPEDAQLRAARYQVDRLLPDGHEADAHAADTDKPKPDPPTAAQRAQIAETAIQQAIRRGEFDNLPGTGKPLKNLDRVYDPDWWVRQKIERENLTGLGPPALTLRTENAHLDDRLDQETSDAVVRGILEDFNTRVIDARRQLLGGPPVVTPIRDIDEEIAKWRERRDARLRAIQEQREHEQTARAAMTWRERRRAKRGR
ncbi:DUF1992 domain-containing protein [Salinibacterium sp. ZJ454]|uniref:DnaJ family domain-containing protein n=1 Tax=Salinibacterium sp. ZJ454 TaxID=2708339 RepID=UPI0014248892|nr:DUF1992 domain-containing protein [Salinibacterium sp. ZJ454]